MKQTFSLRIILIAAVALGAGWLLPQAVTVLGETNTLNNASAAVVQINELKSLPLYRVVNQQGNNHQNIRLEPVGHDWRRVAAGSGFFLTADGYILTNKHVVSDTDATYVVNTDKEQLPAKVVYRDPDQDLALIKVAGKNYPTMSLSASRVTVGEPVLALGYPLGYSTDRVSKGSVIALNRKIVTQEPDETLTGLIQSDARLLPGDSGGPLLDNEGRVIGINVAIAEGTEVSFSIPTSVIRAVVKKAGINWR